MRDYDTIIDKLIEAYTTTQKKVGSWQKDVLLLLLDAIIGIYEEKRAEEYKNLNN